MEGTCIDGIAAVDVSLGVHISVKSIVVVTMVVVECFDVVGDVLENSARVESCDSVLVVVVTIPDFSFDVTYVKVDESVFVVDGKENVFVIAETVVEVVGVSML